MRRYVERLTADEIYESVTEIVCEAVDTDVVVYTERSRSQTNYGDMDKILVVAPIGEKAIVAHDVPENCPLSLIRKREVADFAGACGLCPRAEFLY